MLRVSGLVVSVLCFLASPYIVAYGLYVDAWWGNPTYWFGFMLMGINGLSIAFLMGLLELPNTTHNK